VDSRPEWSRVPNTLALLAHQAWSDVDAAVGGLTPAPAPARGDQQCPIDSTVRHVGQQIDSWPRLRL